MKKIIAEFDKKTWIFVVLVLLITNSLAIVYCMENCSDRLSGNFQKEYPLLSPERDLYNQRDLIVNIQPLRDQLSEIGRDQDISIYFEFLSTGANIAVNKDQKIWPASLMKIPIAMAIMKKIEEGNLRLEDELAMTEKDQNKEFGELYRNSVGTRFTVEKLLDEMLINSDNSARDMLTRKLQTEDFDAVLNHLGIEYDYRNDEQISAKKYSIFWRSLFASSYLNPKNSEKLIEIMARSSANQYSAGVIPSGIKFSHKIGVLYDVNSYADSGIVYVPSRPYILTSMVKGKDQAVAEKIMQDISKRVYAYISAY
jgi:beta-lactamase class A